MVASLGAVRHQHLWANSKPDRVYSDGLVDGHPHHLSGPVAFRPKFRQSQHQTGRQNGPHDEIVEISTPKQSAAPEPAPISELSNASKFLNDTLTMADRESLVMRWLMKTFPRVWTTESWRTSANERLALQVPAPV